jgi:hypothetical protein
MGSKEHVLRPRWSEVMVIKPEIIVGKSKRLQPKDWQRWREESKDELSVLVSFISVLELPPCDITMILLLL